MTRDAVLMVGMLILWATSVARSTCAQYNDNSLTLGWRVVHRFARARPLTILCTGGGCGEFTYGISTDWPAVPAVVHRLGRTSGEACYVHLVAVDGCYSPDLQLSKPTLIECGRWVAVC